MSVGTAAAVEKTVAAPTVVDGMVYFCPGSFTHI